jgi:zinc and cadmium transporter
MVGFFRRVRAWIYIAVALVLNGMAGLAGGLLPERRLLRLLPALVGFAAGALIGAVFLDVLPEALERTGGAGLSWALASFVVMAIIEWSLGHRHHHDHRHHAPEEHHGLRRPALPAAILGTDAIHNIGDGAVIAAALLVSPRVGLAAAFAVVVHEIPQELGDYALLRAAGMARARALALLALVQLSAALGALGVAIGARLLGSLLGVVLGLASGSFLYIAATDLLPEIHAGHRPADRRERMIGFLLGIGVLLAASAL